MIRRFGLISPVSLTMMNQPGTVCSATSTNGTSHTMRRTLTTISLTAALSFAVAAGTAVADEHEAEEPAAEEPAEAECPEGDESGDGDEGTSELEDAAGDAAAAAEALEDGDVCDELHQRSEQAIESLTAAMERLSEEGAGGNGVAADVLAALIAGESPAGIGAEHGAEMAAAAAERRELRAAERAAERADRDEHGKPEGAGKPDHAGKPAHAGKP